MNRIISATQSIQKLKTDMSFFLTRLGSMSLSDEGRVQELIAAAKFLSSAIDSDKLFESFIRLQQEPNAEVILKQLAIRIEMRVREYEKRLKALRSRQVIVASSPKNNQMGAWSDIFSGKDESTLAREEGLRLLQAYYDEAKNYVEFTYPDFETFLTWAESIMPMANNLGELRRRNDLTTSESDSTERMKELANGTHGQATLVQMVQAVGGGGDTRNWSAFVPELASSVVSETGKVVGESLQSVGQGVVGTMKLTKYLPWILLGAGALYIYTSASSGHLTKALEGIKKRMKK